MLATLNALNTLNNEFRDERSNEKDSKVKVQMTVMSPAGPLN